MHPSLDAIIVGALMDREHNQALSDAIYRLNRNMSDLTELHGAVGSRMAQALRAVLRALEPISQPQPTQDLDGALVYFQNRAASADQARRKRLRWAADPGAIETSLTAFARARR